MSESAENDDVPGGEVVVESSSEHGSDGQVKKASGVPTRAGLPLRLAVWAACLSAATGFSICLRLVRGAPDTLYSVALLAALAVGYLVVFAHCLTRLVYSRWPSWLLFTIGFGIVSCGSMLGIAIEAAMVHDQFLRERLEILRVASLPAAVALLLWAAHAARARSTGTRPRAWRNFVRSVVLCVALLVAWKAGEIDALEEILSATNADLRLGVYIACAGTFAALLHRNIRLATSSHDEIIVPIAYWAAAMMIGMVLSLVTWRQPDALWWQVGFLEFVGLAALLIGLSLENERAHRKAAEQMDDLQAMQRISWSLVGTSDLNEMSSALACAVSEGFDAPLVAVYLADDGKENLVVAATSGIEDPSVAVGKVCSLRPERRPGFHSGHTARAFASGSPQTVREILSDVEFLPWREVARRDGTVCSIPLPYQDRTVGVLNLFVSSIVSVPESRIKLLQAVAAAVSPAIESARVRQLGLEELDRAA